MYVCIYVHRRNTATGELIAHVYNGNYYNNQLQQFWPSSPVPGFNPPMAPWNMPFQQGRVMIVVPPNDKTSKKKKESGHWEAMYGDDGSKCWRHTETGMTRGIDPYV